MRGWKRNKLFVVVAFAALAAGALALGARSSARNEPSKDVTTPVYFSVTPPAEAAARSIGYVVRSSSNEPLASGSIAVAPGQTAVTAELNLPPGLGDQITFLVNPGSSVAGERAYVATQSFVVGADGNTRVNVGAEHFAPVANGAASNVAAAASSAALSAAATSKPNCQACELASEQGRCDPELLTATWNTDPNHDQPSWGCDTLPSPAQKSACAALLHCLASTRCAQDDSPVMSCYCGSAAAAPCFAGEGIDGPCGAFYRAAAVVSADGPDVAASAAEVSRFVATYASNPKTPIGLADNINECALAAHCDDCGAL